MFLFKKKFLPAIRAGEKTQTVSDSGSTAACGFQAYSLHPRLATSRSIRSMKSKLDQLTDEETPAASGFASVALLRAAKSRNCTKTQLTAGYRAYRVIFHTVEKEAAVEEAAEQLE